MDHTFGNGSSSVAGPDYLALRRGANYCDQRVCMSVCPAAYLNTHKSRLIATVAWFSFDGNAIMLRTSGFVDGVRFSHNRANTQNQR